MANFGTETRVNLPPGWRAAEPWSEQGYIVDVDAGDGVLNAAPAVMVTREIPSGSKVYIEKLAVRIVDQGAYDQMIFSLKRNGAKISPWEKISGEQVHEEFNVDVDQVFDSGVFEIVAANISGTSETGAAADAMTIRAIARFKGLLLRPAGKGFV
jgi:hypothetical protein